MKKNTKNIHIGEIIKSKYIESGMSISKFASLINCERTNVYSIFKRKSIDTDKLLIISKVLNFDFISEIYLKERKLLPLDYDPNKHVVLIIDKQALSCICTSEIINPILKISKV
jgi:plasmid maintenance system antidote protein VapI